MKIFRYFAILILWTSLPLALSGAQQPESREAKAIRQGGTPYFTTKIENLTTVLELTPDQQAKLKPIAAQEVGMFEQIRGNTVLSRKDKIAKLKQIVLDSDEQMRPWLSAVQWEKLQSLRKGQKEQLKQYANTAQK